MAESNGAESGRAKRALSESRGFRFGAAGAVAIWNGFGAVPGRAYLAALLAFFSWSSNLPIVVSWPLRYST